MSVPKVHQLSMGPITTHAFTADRKKVAVCPNTHEVQIYNSVGENWTLEHTLVDHDKIVTSIDIAPNTNRIVTCSQDRNAYVWTFDGTQWKQTLVLLRINRAATHVRWSPNEDKFAVASGARAIAICYFEEDNDWWFGKHLKKPIRSTVLSIDWHPNNVLLAAGSADNKARVFSAYIKGIDKKPSVSAWGDKFPFNTVCGEFSSRGWVHGVAFSPSGDALAFAGHDASVHVVYPSPDQSPVVITIETPSLPYLSLFWASENRIIAAGHDCVPALFETSNGQDWHLSGTLDQGKRKMLGETTAFNKFKQIDSRGQAETDNDLVTAHQNTITQLSPYAGTRDNVTHFSTSGIDGKLVIWEFDPSRLSTAFSNVKVFADIDSK